MSSHTNQALSPSGLHDEKSTVILDAAVQIGSAHQDLVNPGSLQEVSNKKNPVEHENQAAVDSDDGLALAFTKRHCRDLRYVSEWKKWFIWNGTRWEPDRTLVARDLVRDFCRDVATQYEAKKSSRSLASMKKINAVERLAQADRRHAATTDEWDQNNWLLNTPGGIVDLKQVIRCRMSAVIL